MHVKHFFQKTFIIACLCSPLLGFSELPSEQAIKTFAPVHLSDDLTNDLTDDRSQESTLLVQNDTDSDVDSTDPKTTTLTVLPIVTTRPSFTDAWLSIPKGSFQMESGATFTDNGDGTKSWLLPESLLKLGVTENTEVRFSVPNYTFLKADHGGTLVNNFGDISVGIAHHRVFPGKVYFLVVPVLNIPTGANKASSNSVDPQLRMVVAKYLTSKLVLSSQMDARWNAGRKASTHVMMNPTFISYYSFTDKLTGFIEYGGFIPTQGKSTHYFQSGLLYLRTKRQQLDARVAMGLNKASSDFLVGFGYSFRVDGLFD